MVVHLFYYLYLAAVTSFHSEGLLSDDECRKACKNWIRSVIEMQYCKDAVIAEDSAVLLEKSGNEEAATTLRGRTLCI